MIRPGAWKRVPERWDQSSEEGAADQWVLAAEDLGGGRPGCWESASWRGPACLLPLDKLDKRKDRQKLDPTARVEVRS